MDTITTLNAIKSVFSGLGAKTSDSSYAVPLVDSSSAEPKGFMSMANLASVLGVKNSTKIPQIITGTSYDDTTILDLALTLTRGVHIYNTTGGNYYRIVIHDGNCITIFKENIYSPSLGLKYNRKYNGTWGGWKNNYDESILTNSELLTPLASALGGLSAIKQVNTLDSGIVDDITSSMNAASSGSLFSGTSPNGQHEGGWYGVKVHTPTTGASVSNAIVLYLGCYDYNFDVQIGKWDGVTAQWTFYKVFV